MADFKISYAKTAINEGGYTNNPDDSGNWTGGKKGVGNLVGTKNGVSAPVLSSFLRRNATIEDMKNISVDTCMTIYRKEYWNAIHGDEIISQEIADSLYDSAVNFGVSAAVKIFQKSVSVPDTGKMDTLTLNKLNNKR